MLTIRHIVYECVPGAYVGGVQKIVFELASAQRRAGADVEIWTLDAIRAGAREDHGGLPIRYFMPEAALGLAQSYRLEKALESLPPGSCLHAHNTFHPLNLQVGRAARRFRQRAFYHPHGALDQVLLRGWQWKTLKKRLYVLGFERPNLNSATGVFAETLLAKQQLLALGVTAPVHVVPNGIRPVVRAAPELGRAFRHRHGIPPGVPLLLFIGRITPKKRLEDILAILPRLAREYPDLHLVVGGDFAQELEYRRGLLREIAKTGVAGRVLWVGFLDEQAKPAAYAASQVFVHASESEGMAIAILEAMSAGLPVVATRGCYMGAAAAAGAILECAQGAEALADAVRVALVSGAEIGARGRAYVQQVHDWDAIARQTFRVYEGR